MAAVAVFSLSLSVYLINYYIIGGGGGTASTFWDGSADRCHRNHCEMPLVRARRWFVCHRRRWASRIYKEIEPRLKCLRTRAQLTAQRTPAPTTAPINQTAKRNTEHRTNDRLEMRAVAAAVAADAEAGQPAAVAASRTKWILTLLGAFGGRGGGDARRRRRRRPRRERSA